MHATFVQLSRAALLPRLVGLVTLLKGVDKGGGGGGGGGQGGL